MCEREAKDKALTHKHFPSSLMVTWLLKNVTFNPLSLWRVFYIQYSPHVIVLLIAACITFTAATCPVRHFCAQQV